MNMASLKVNAVSVEWDEVPRRVAKPCAKCGAATHGRLRVNNDGSPTSAAVCMKCCWQAMADIAFRPIGDVVRALREALGGPATPRTPMSGGRR